MGGSPPSAPTVVMPAPTAPTTYQSVVPLESYKQASDYLRRLTEKTEDIAQQRYQEVGTPAEIGARQAQRRVKEEAAYLAAVPQTDKYMTEITGATDRFGPVREAAKLGTTAATEDYLQALQRAEEKPKAITFETPSWATSTIPEGMPGYQPSKPAEPVKEEKPARAPAARQRIAAAPAPPTTRFQITRG